MIENYELTPYDKSKIKEIDDQDIGCLFNNSKVRETLLQKRLLGPFTST
ncbi:Uncharacterised protein [Legionella steigerwaltii]|uniref:Uncharacterized protein n=1 Tax=Legionella steigerwaltii TaxID=460 RepID=A0A378LJ49_9GAMM|nr:Uncharacterised protein [Legionella steigerwaltii]